MFPIILITGWHTALHLMHLGDWATRERPGVFLVTPAAPRPGPIFELVGKHGMLRLIRHGWECTHAARAWLCTPNQIPR